jgi:hypothetical protein
LDRQQKIHGIEPGKTSMIVPENPKRQLIAEMGPYSVWHDPLAHRPYGLFRIWHGDRYVGAQISYPCRSDCEFLERRHKQHAEAKVQAAKWTQKLRGVAVKRGRPRKYPLDIPVLAELTP